MSARGYLTDREWREMFEAQGERCCVKGCTSDGPFEAEHSTPVAFVSGKPDQIMCVKHHKQKTRRDKREIARAKRLSGETRSQWSRRKERKAEGWPPLLRGAGFRKPKTREEILGAKP
jgi:4-hydroxy-3-methylbut-2-en-1-yl diphosphate synthase IspG/GcpE